VSVAAQRTRRGASRRTRFCLALAGAGRMGRTHLRALADSSDVVVSDVVEPVAEIRHDLAAEGRRVHESLDALLAGSPPDGLLVTAPTRFHEEIVSSAVAASVPVLCEKPAGLTAEQVARVGWLAAEADVPFQVAYWRRHVPELRALRERIRAGALGEIHLVLAFQWDEAPPAAAFRAASGGLFVDMGVHELDQLRWLTGGEITGISGVTSKGDGDEPDSAQALLTLSKEVAGVVSLGRYHPGGDVAGVEIFGTGGHERVLFLDPAHADAVLHEALRRQAKAFAEHVRTGAPAGASVEDAVAALEWAQAATAAAVGSSA
jgi:myo-inositol 2-dehydrogenase / D-chiro-inositol 1-dehydrogenase